LLGLFAVQTVITVVLTGDIPENFILFAIGFLLLFVGHLLIAPGLRETLGRAWVLPLVGAAGIVVAITLMTSQSIRSTTSACSCSRARGSQEHEHDHRLRPLGHRAHQEREVARAGRGREVAVVGAVAVGRVVLLRAERRRQPGTASASV
jgi:hypothetical protein